MINDNRPPNDSMAPAKNFDNGYPASPKYNSIGWKDTDGFHEDGLISIAMLCDSVVDHKLRNLGGFQSTWSVIHREQLNK